MCRIRTSLDIFMICSYIKIRTFFNNTIHKYIIEVHNEKNM